MRYGFDPDDLEMVVMACDPSNRYPYDRPIVNQYDTDKLVDWVIVGGALVNDHAWSYYNNEQIFVIDYMNSAEEEARLEFVRYEDEEDDWALTGGSWPDPWDFEANALMALRILTSEMGQEHDARTTAESLAKKALEVKGATVVTMTVNAEGQVERPTPPESPAPAPAESVEEWEMPPDLPF